jgi:hypothetical protein
LFWAGIYSDRIQTIVRSRNHSSFDDVAETAVEEESAFFSKNERYKNGCVAVDGPKCSNYNKLGHVASRCYLKDRKDTRVNQLSGMTTEKKAVMWSATIAKVGDTWRGIAGNPKGI